MTYSVAPTTQIMAIMAKTMNLIRKKSRTPMIANNVNLLAS